MITFSHCTASSLARRCFVVTGLTLSIVLGGCDDHSAAPSESLAEVLDDTALEHAQKHLDPKYVCPMHPQIIRDEPGNCPICGMNLVAKRIIGDGTAKRPIVKVRGEVIQNMGLRTALVERKTLWKYIRTVGRVMYDETRLHHVHPRAEGWMEKFNLKSEGDPVKRGQVLGQFYSPEILGAQVDFLIARNDSAGFNSKIRLDKARNRLRLLGVTESTIRRIEQNGQTSNTIPITAPANGVVTMLGARKGMYVTPSQEIVTLADLSKIWVLVDVFEHQIDWLKVGLTAEITVPAYPGKRWEGAVEYIYPDLDPKSRTLRVRLAFNNRNGRLKANMFADVVIYGGPKLEALAVPREALIETGERKSVVKALGEGRFEPVDVVIGMTRGDDVEVLEGLSEGDRIVVSGQFLIDSESSLQASFQRMAPDTTSAMTGVKAN